MASAQPLDDKNVHDSQAAHSSGENAVANSSSPAAGINDASAQQDSSDVPLSTAVSSPEVVTDHVIAMTPDQAHNEGLDAGIMQNDTSAEDSSKPSAQRFSLASDDSFRSSQDGAGSDEDDIWNRDEEWVADGDVLSETVNSDAEATSSADSKPKDGKRKQAAASKLGSKLRRGAGKFGGAAKRAIVAETNALVTDAKEIAFGIREGAQLTAQDTMEFKDKISGGIRGFFSSGRRKGSKAAVEVGDVNPQEASATVAVSSSSSVPAGATAAADPAPKNPLQALSRGLVAQLGASEDAPVSSQGKVDVVSPESSTDLTATEKVDASSKQEDPLSADVVDDGTVSTATPTSSRTTVTSTSQPDQFEGIAASDRDGAEKKSSTQKATSASMTSRFKTFSAKATAAVSFKGLRMGLQAAGTVGQQNSAVNVAVHRSDKEFVALPSTRANYVQVAMSTDNTGSSSSSSADPLAANQVEISRTTSSAAKTEPAAAQSTATADESCVQTDGCSETTPAQGGGPPNSNFGTRLGGWLSQARGNFAAAATSKSRSNAAEDAEPPKVGLKRTTSGQSGSNEDLFAIGSDIGSEDDCSPSKRALEEGSAYKDAAFVSVPTVVEETEASRTSDESDKLVF